LPPRLWPTRRTGSCRASNAAAAHPDRRRSPGTSRRRCSIARGRNRASRGRRCATRGLHGVDHELPGGRNVAPAVQQEQEGRVVVAPEADMQAATTDVEELGSGGFHPAILAAANRLAAPIRRGASDSGFSQSGITAVASISTRAASSIKTGNLNCGHGREIAPDHFAIHGAQAAIGRKVLALVEHVPGHADDVLRDDRRPRPARRRCSPAPGAPGRRNRWCGSDTGYPSRSARRSAITRPRASMPFE
jgi:hypothetical protein